MRRISFSIALFGLSALHVNAVTASDGYGDKTERLPAVEVRVQQPTTAPVVVDPISFSSHNQAEALLPIGNDLVRFPQDDAAGADVVPNIVPDVVPDGAGDAVPEPAPEHAEGMIGQPGYGTGDYCCNTGGFYLWEDYCAMRNQRRHNPIGSGFRQGCGPDSSCDIAFDDSACSICYDPRLTLRFNALLMRRVASSRATIITDQANNAVLLDSNTFDFNYEPGFEFDMLYELDECDTFEMRVFWLNDWSETIRTNSSATGINLLTNPATTRPLTQTITSNYESELNNLEFNIRRRWWNNGTVLAGFRFLELNERLGLNIFDTTGPPLVEDFGWTTKNQLVGLQIGADHDLSCWNDRLTFDGMARGGLYLNSLRADMQRVQNQGGGVIPGPVFGFDKEKDIAIMAELGINANFRLHRNWAFRTGYNLMWIDGVALAGEQVSTTSSGGGAGLLNGQVLLNANKGTAFFHGFVFGLEGRW